MIKLLCFIDANTRLNYALSMQTHVLMNASSDIKLIR